MAYVLFWAVVILFIGFLAAWPAWPYSQAWGYAPSAGLITALVLILLSYWLGLVAVWWPWGTP